MRSSVGATRHTPATPPVPQPANATGSTGHTRHTLAPNGPTSSLGYTSGRQSGSTRKWRSPG
nr:MAG TPA: hypothetical protein [Caudoviricetes sp.]